ncbi:hypothetical protein CDN99_05435 [Roseateles aquatilis]|uniref:CDP-alcohol phosphatidyltransferase n=1 Tax=Roseateles aquatilis TaxID=431061 RepID=A0A246JMU6_9BURK|nr:CDP-alcohol phosphatidyltransferase family protein [Roseateles aquatilis]OWQ93870.1 hypothetical protein CDN99_05435 [Roseateles aquatilis]
MRHHLPWMLTALRAALAPVMVALAFIPAAANADWIGLAFGLCLTTAFLSDIFDGVLARRWGVATPTLRRMDSVADSLFYVGATVAVWHLRPDAITSRCWPLLALLALELARYAFDWLKFRREAAYHMWSSKLWGLALFAGFVSLLAFGEDGWAVDAAVFIGIVADLEGLAISMVLPVWRNDVPSLAHALRIRDTHRGS